MRDSPARQGGKALKWILAHFNFERKIHLLFQERDHTSGHFVHKSECGTRDGAFIYALSADETLPALAAQRHEITVLFSCRFKCHCFPGDNFIFATTPAERITHYTLRRKVVCQGASPFGNLRQQNRRYAALSGSIPPFVVSSPFLGLRVVPCKLT